MHVKMHIVCVQYGLSFTVDSETLTVGKIYTHKKKKIGVEMKGEGGKFATEYVTRNFNYPDNQPESVFSAENFTRTEWEWITDGRVDDDICLWRELYILVKIRPRKLDTTHKLPKHTTEKDNAKSET
jgi:hypothetical protein